MSGIELGPVWINPAYAQNKAWSFGGFSSGSSGDIMFAEESSDGAKVSGTLRNAPRTADVTFDPASQQFLLGFQDQNHDGKLTPTSGSERGSTLVGSGGAASVNRLLENLGVGIGAYANKWGADRWAVAALGDLESAISAADARRLADPGRADPATRPPATDLRV